MPSMDTGSKKGPPNAPAGHEEKAPADPRSNRQTDLERGRPLGELQLPAKAENALLRNGIRTVGQLIARSPDELMNESIALGQGSLAVIEEALTRNGLSLATNRKARRYERQTHAPVPGTSETIMPG